MADFCRFGPGRVDRSVKVLVLGAYGLIGAEIVRDLTRAGHEVVGFGRSADLGRRLVPGIAWIGGDLARMTRPETWTAALAGVEAVVNASGALQDGLKDRLTESQNLSIAALIRACEAVGARRFVQISAPGAEPTAATAFLRTKAAADAVLRASTLDWIVLKPGLVVGANAYGGTSLLRMLAAFPLIQPLVLGDRPVQTVALAEVAAAVTLAVSGQVPGRRDYDLMEPRPRALREVVAAFRRWLGFPPAWAALDLPDALGFALARGADLAGWLGWRSPLRTTALRVMAEGVTGDPEPWTAATGRRFGSLEKTLTALPSTLQERSFARGRLVFPMLLGLLSMFWLASGVIGAWRLSESMRVLDGVMPEAAAGAFVLAGAAADVAIGVCLLVRRWTRPAACAAISLSLGYMAAATVLTPWLWSDPLGPLVKILPGIGLALAVAALAEER